MYLLNFFLKQFGYNRRKLNQISVTIIAASAFLGYNFLWKKGRQKDLSYCNSSVLILERKRLFSRSFISTRTYTEGNECRCKCWQSTRRWGLPSVSASGWLWSLQQSSPCFQRSEKRYKEFIDAAQRIPHCTPLCCPNLVAIIAVPSLSIQSSLITSSPCCSRCCNFVIAR